jgi:hypothetical protein
MFALAILASALAVLPSFAQSTGGLRVRVVDEDKMGFPGVVVTLSNANGFVGTTNVVTDGQGIALFPVLRPDGTYVVSAFVPGYARVTLPNIRVKASETTEVPIALTPEELLTETVEVTVDRQVVELEDTTSTTRYSEEFIRDLPVQGRFYQNVLTLAPGVQDDDGDGNPNVHGARERDFKASVGGVSNQDPLTGGWLNVVNFDSIEEVEVITAGAGAEYGRAQGGFANIIQKQGSNDFEGTFNFLYRSSKLDGNGASNIPASRLGEFESVRPAISLSGPIVRDKLWYRLNHEYVKEDEPVNTGTTVVSQPLRQTINADQITWQVSDRNKLAMQFQYDPLEVENLGVSSFTPVESSFRLKQGGPTYSLTWSAPYSPKIFVESLASYQDYELEYGPTVASATNACRFPSEFSGLNSASCFDIDSGQQSGSFPVAWDDARQRLTVKSDATFFIGNFLRMQHEVKTGLIVENERYFRRINQAPSASLGRFTEPEGNTGEFNTVVLVGATVPIEPVSEARATGTTWSVYATDTFKPRSNVSVTVGVRVDREEINAPGFEPFDPGVEYDAWESTLIPGVDPLPEDRYDAFTAYENLQGLEQSLNEQIAGTPEGGITLTGALQTAQNWTNVRRRSDVRLRNTNVGPRISASWDPWNNGKQKFAATAGRFYDKVFLQVPLVESQAPLVNAQFLMDETENGLVSRGKSVYPVLSFSFVDRNLSTPYKDEFTFSFEREIFTETSLKISLIKSKFRDQLQDIDMNRIPDDFGRCIRPSTQNPGLVVAASPGTGTIVDPYTGEVYEDIDPGDGDGRLDDCAGDFIPVEEPNPFDPEKPNLVLLVGPDGIVDLYGRNPAWGSVFLIGNFNRAEYEAIVLEMVRRQYKDWQMEASYTWSQAKGDAEDWNLFLGNDRTTLEDEKGFLSYDRTHQLKLNATRIFRGGIRLGTSVTWQSGLPWSILRQDFSAVTYAPAVSEEGGLPSALNRFRYLTGQRNDQRNNDYWNVDLKATKEFALPKGIQMQLSALVENLFNDGTYIIYNEAQNVQSGRQINGVNEATNRFGRRYELSMRLAF